MASNAANSNLLNVLANLKRIKNLNTLLEQEFRDLTWNTKQRIFVELFSSLKMNSVKEFLDSELKIIKTIRNKDEKQASLNALEKVFYKFVAQELKSLNYTVSLAQLQTDRNANYKAFSFLLDKLKLGLAPVPIQEVEPPPQKLEKPKLPQIRSEPVAEPKPAVVPPNITVVEQPQPVIKEQIVPVQEDFLPGKSIVTKSTKPDENFYETTQALRKQVKELKEEKENLQNEVNTLKDTIQSLLELKKENNSTVDERRILLIKAQNLQLERQVVMLTNFITAHKENIAGIKSELAALEGEILSTNKNNTAAIKADKALKWINTFQQKLNKLGNTDLVDRPFYHFPNKYAQHFEDLKVIDISSHTQNIMNVKMIHQLEKYVVQAYKDMLVLKSNINTLVQPQLLKPLEDAIHVSVNRFCKSAEKAVMEMTTLGVLVPEPLHAEKKDTPTKITLKQMLEREKVWNIEKEIFDTQLKMYERIREFEVVYTTRLIGELQNYIEVYESKLHNAIYKPIQDLLFCFNKFLEWTSEDNLRSFLNMCKIHLLGFTAVIPNLVSEVQQQVIENPLFTSMFQEEFQTEITRIIEECQKEHSAILEKQLTNVNKE